MNIFDIIYMGLSPYFAIKFLNKYGVTKVALDYINNRINIKPKILKSDKKNILLHGASIGETLSLLPLKDAVEKKFFSIRVIVSTSTHTAYNLLHSKNGTNSDFLYMPFDFNNMTKKFLHHVNPCVLVITEQEIWPNLIFNAYKLRIPIFFVNFRIKPQKMFMYNFSLYKQLQLKIYIA